MKSLLIKKLLQDSGLSKKRIVFIEFLTFMQRSGLAIFYTLLIEDRMQKISLMILLLVMNSSTQAAPGAIAYTDIRPFIGKYTFLKGDSRFGECFSELYIGIDKVAKTKKLLQLEFKGKDTEGEWKVELYPMVNQTLKTPGSSNNYDKTEYGTKVSNKGEKVILNQVATTTRKGKIMYVDYITMTGTKDGVGYSRTSDVRSEVINCKYERVKK